MKINERVEIIAGELKGSQGVIRSAVKGFIGVELDEEFEGGSNLNGLCPDKKGYWTKQSQLSKITRFKVGQPVYVIDNNDDFYGLKGKVACIKPEEDYVVYGVEFEFESPSFISLGGICDDNHGYWFNEDDLIEEDKYIQPQYSTGDKVLIRLYSELVEEFGVDGDFIKTSKPVIIGYLRKLTVGKLYEVKSARLSYIKVLTTDYDVIEVPNEAVILPETDYTEPYYCAYEKLRESEILFDTGTSITNPEVSTIVSNFAAISYMHNDYNRFHDSIKNIGRGTVGVSKFSSLNSDTVYKLNQFFNHSSIKNRGTYLYDSGDQRAALKEACQNESGASCDSEEILFWNEQGKFVLLLNCLNIDQLIRAFTEYFKSIGVCDSIIEAVHDPNALKAAVTNYIAEYKKIEILLMKQEAAEKINNTMYKKCIAKVDSEIRDKLEYIQSYENALRDYYKALKDLRIRKLGLESSAGEENDLLPFLKSCKTISNIKVINNSILFTTTQPCVMYERKEYELSRFRSNPDYQRVPNWQFDLLDDIFLNNKITLNFQDSVEVNLESFTVRFSQGEYDTSNKEGIPNPHHYYYDCWGEHATYFTESLSRGDVVQLINQIMAAVSGINFADSSVTSKFIRKELNDFSNIKCLTNNETKERMTINKYRESWEESLQNKMKGETA